MYIARCINLCNSDDEASETADGDRSACEEERVIMLFVLCGFKYCILKKEPAVFSALL